MSFTDFLARNPHPTEAEIRDVLSGHLCRCTGYANIVEAIKEVPESELAGLPIRHPEVAAKAGLGGRWRGRLGRHPSRLAALAPQDDGTGTGR